MNKEKVIEILEDIRDEQRLSMIETHLNIMDN